MINTRVESDLLGQKEVPADVYYGVQTARAIENFHITEVRLNRFSTFISAFAKVKKAAALANHEVGLLDGAIKDAICKACDEVIGGALHDQFVVDMIQGGAGTSTNMNTNEVIANRALELMGHEKGQYEFIHPNSHVNMSQSTNDAYPTSMHVATDAYLERLLAALAVLQSSLEKKAAACQGMLKMGRTHLQDAVPMTAGQEFGAMAAAIKKEAARIEAGRSCLYEINMGGTAIGTGLNAHPQYAAAVAKHLSAITGKPYHTADDLVEATTDTSPYVYVSSLMRLLATRLSKMCNDLRLLSSGPRAGLQNIRLPERQPGSSIMPGKVNPVIPEVVNQTCFHVMGVDHTIALAAEAGQLQLNVFEPVIAFNLFTEIVMLANAVSSLAEKCIDGIEVNAEYCHEQVMHNIGLVTALSPHMSYAQANAVAREARESGRGVYEIVLEKGWLSKEQLDEILKPENMLKPQLGG